MNNTILTINGQKVWATEAQYDAMIVLNETRKGGMATVHGYIPKTNWKECPIQNIQFISRFSTLKMYERQIAALKALRFDQLDLSKEPKLAALTEDEAREIFQQRKDKEIASKEKTLSNDRSDAYRQSHDRNYIQVSEGIKVHLITETGDDGLKHPVLTDGLPAVSSIMVSAIFLNTTTVKEGTRKVVNSGAPVLMSKAIQDAINRPGLVFRALSLKADNFDSLMIDKETVIPDEYINIA